ncbi:MAG: hypothetical protein ACRCYX_10725 [Dermatophilaceae bacterium]
MLETLHAGAAWCMTPFLDLAVRLVPPEAVAGSALILLAISCRVVVLGAHRLGGRAAKVGRVLLTGVPIAVGAVWVAVPGARPGPGSFFGIEDLRAPVWGNGAGAWIVGGLVVVATIAVQRATAVAQGRIDERTTFFLTRMLPVILGTLTVVVIPAGLQLMWAVSVGLGWGGELFSRASRPTEVRP